MSSSCGSQLPPSTAARAAQMTCSIEAFFGTKPTAPARTASTAVARSA
ncbi:MAG TPA: hypothetical protein VKV35_05795 [Streptosporangiaceae bacterium]|nr:hypothetical protein [Streptosporangiaceae bacterium]